jgi:hypothetical protein
MKKAFKAVNKATGMQLTGTGIREACKVLWGTLPNGQPKYVSSAIESALGIRTTDVQGWVFTYTNDIVVGGKNKKVGKTNKPKPKPTKTKGGYTPRTKPTILTVLTAVGKDPISQAIQTY